METSYRSQSYWLSSWRVVSRSFDLYIVNDAGSDDEATVAVNLRKSVSTSSSKIMSLSNGTSVKARCVPEIVKHHEEGHQNHNDVVELAVIGGATSSSVVALLAKGTKVTGKKTGWVYSAYLK